jgi:hypothetical protein
MTVRALKAAVQPAVAAAIYLPFVHHEDYRPLVASTAGKWSNLGPLRWRQGIVHIDAEVPDRILDVGVAEEDLHRPSIARCFVDQRRLGPVHRVRAIISFVEADR